MIVGSSAVSSKTIPIITLLLLIINVGVFLKSYSLEIAASNDESRISIEVNEHGEAFLEQSETEKDIALMDFFNLWGFQFSDLKNGEFHSVFSSLFVHGGLFHLVGNMLAFWAFAIAMEELFGAIGFTFLYFGTGVVACLMQGLFMMNSESPIIGASGAVAGVMGAFTVLLGFKAHVKVLIWFMGYRIVNIPAPVFAGIWLFPQLINLSENGVAGGGVALISHLAGFGVGAAVALVMGKQLKSRISEQSDGNLVIEGKEEPEEADEKKILDEILACRPYTEVIDTLGDCQIGCPECGNTLNLHDTVADRLVKCTNNMCDKMTYIDGELLAQHL